MSTTLARSCHKFQDNQERVNRGVSFFVKAELSYREEEEQFIILQINYKNFQKLFRMLKMNPNLKEEEF